MLTQFLNQAFWRLNKIVPKKTKHPVLSYVHFCSDGHTLSITATNLERWLTIQIPSDGSVFECIAPFEILKRLFKVCPDEVTLKTEGDRLWLMGESFQYSFLCLPLEQYPTGSGSELITLPTAAKTRRKPSQSISGTTPPPIQKTASTEQKSPSYADGIVPFTRPIKSHPELGTLEPECSEAYSQLQKQLSGEVETIMPEYAISVDEIKQAVAVSLRPDQAYELTCGISKVILIEELDEEIFNLTGHYCLIHAAQVEGRDLEQSLDGFKSLKLSPDFAPPGSILGYCIIAGTKKYTPEEWVKDRQAGKHDHQEDLDVFKKLAGITGDLYAVEVRGQKMLAETVYEVSGGMRFFWSPGNPYDSATFRSVFEADRLVIDVDKEELEMALQG
jgi:hypothetical protein